ncbi:hypothetical protein V8E36_000827 [Tilletia maclaganii]
MAPPFSIASALGKGKGAVRSAETLDLDAASDPTDWVNTSLSFLKTLDSSLRCTLCFDIYTAPVVLRECHHTFCSVCIRSHINQPEDKGRFCPQCRQTKVSDTELVPVQGLEEAAEAWRQSRPKLVQTADRLEDLSRTPQETTGRGASADEEPAQGVADSNRTAETPRGVKRKLGEAHSAAASPAESSARRTRQSTAASREASGNHSGSKPSSPLKRDSFQSPQTSSLKVTELKATDVTRCPICNSAFTLAKLNAHLDKGCDGTKVPDDSPSASKSSWFVRPNGENSLFRNGGKVPFEDAKKLVRPQYVGRTDAGMKKLLEADRLPTGGNKERMVARHRQWVNIFNANLDAAPAKRQTEAQLRRALSEWERGKDEEERNRARGGMVSEDKSKTWAKDHKSEFADLISKARETHTRNKDTTRAMPVVKGRIVDQHADENAAGPSLEHGSGADDDEVEWMPGPPDRRASGKAQSGYGAEAGSSEEHMQGEAELDDVDFFAQQ